MKTKIIKLDNLGRGITYINNKICFINNAFPEEEIEYKIIKETSKYYEGEVTNIIKRSDKRCKSNCEYSTLCGGCTFQEYNYEEENKYKEEIIKDLVKRILKEDEKIVKSIKYEKEDSYRNKIILHGSNNKLGLYKNKSNEIIQIKHCNIANDKINDIISKLSNHKGIEEVLIRTSNDLNEVLLDIKSNLENYNEFLGLADVLIVNDKTITKKDSIITNVGNKKYYLSSKSFFQVNISLTKQLFDKIVEYVKVIKPKNVLDLYCGTGSIGIYISEYANKIIGVDCNRSNIEDAKKNNKLNDINNIEYICDKVENCIDKFKDYDLVIVDPPRSGLDKLSIEHIKKMSPKNIIYVSCNPQTLIRDIKLLNDNYKNKEITPYNMFPRTYHCESVTVLERK